MVKKILFVGNDNLCVMAEHLASQTGFESDSAVISKVEPINKTQLGVMKEYKIDIRMCTSPSLLDTKQKDTYDYVIALKSNIQEHIKEFKGELILWDTFCDLTEEGFRFIGGKLKKDLQELFHEKKMKEKIKTAIVLGTRPEIIKLAPIIKNQKNINVYHTNQHYDENMDSNFFKELDLPDVIARYNKPFEIGESINWLTCCFEKDKPDLVMVYGDTNSSLVGAVAAKQLNIKVAHIEAGLRSHDKRMQEEYNRIIVDHISDYLFAPTNEAVDNLKKEGINKEKIFNVGNTIADMVEKYKDKYTKVSYKKDYLLLTMHRAENVDKKCILSDLIKAMEQISTKFKMPIIFPIHPRTKKKLIEFGLFKRLKNIKDMELIEPTSYIQMLNLEKNATIVITSSGGLQEEACILGTPCITIRKTTERPETVLCGSNKVVGTKPDRIISAVEYWLKNKRKKWQHPYGENVAEKILAKIEEQDIKNIQIPLVDRKEKPIQTIFEKRVIGELMPQKDIVIFGTLAPWEIVKHGQRIAQIINYWIKEGHNILYIEPYKSKDYEKYETKNFKLYCFAEDNQWNWWQTDIGKNTYKRKKELHDFLDKWQSPSHQPIVVYEMPLPDYVELLDVFIERNFRVIYELIDKWDGMYLGDKIRVPNIEKYLVDRSDILIGTSTLLVKELMDISGSKEASRQDIQLIPNAFNPDLFNPKKAGKMPIDMEKCLKNGDYKKIIFYMGPVQCEWFDWENYLALMKAYPDYKFICIGWNCERDNFTNKDYAKLTECKNFAFLGRKTHNECLDYVYHSDICIIPFRDIPMIHATSPNKLFEYLACYKPVINIDSKDFKNYPAMSLVKGGRWIDALEKASNMEIDKEEIDKFLDKNTWEDRANRIMECYTSHQKELSKIESYGYMNWSHGKVKIIKSEKKCSIIMLNLNTIEYTEEAINSIKYHTSYPYELIVVDNGSKDNSVEILKKLKKDKIIDKLVISRRNLGFAGGNNLGLKEATGDYYGFINNDVIVSPNWLSKLIKVLEKDEKIGAVGPVSNNVGGINFPQRVKFINEKRGIVEEIPRLSGFCVVFTKEAINKVGNWDERFFPGFFEDDDICIRLNEAGYKLKYCGDSFIYHKMQSTFIKNNLDGNDIYKKNKERFEQKWKGKYPSVLDQ